MKLFCFSSLNKPSNFLFKVSGANAGIENENQAIEAADSALDLYYQLSTKTVPWNRINGKIQELKNLKGVSKNDAELFGETVTSVMNGMDARFNAIQNIREWCGLASGLLTTYNRQLNKAESSTVQKTLLVRVLGNEIDKMDRARVQLDSISSNFKEAAGKMTTMQNRLKNKSDAESKLIKKFVESFDDELNRACTKIDETNRQLQDRIKTIDNLKVQIEGTGSYVSTDELRSITAQSVQKLIADCNEYRKL